MSQAPALSFLCPSCGRPQSPPPVPLLNADATPELKRQLMEGRYPVHRCGHCHQFARVNAEMVYADVTARLVVWAAPDVNDTRAVPAIPDALRDSLDRAIGLYTLRRVESMIELIEKVLIHEEGMDDRLVEALKLVVGAQLAREGRPPDAPLLFGGRNRRTDGTTALDLVCVTDKGVQSLAGPFEAMYEELAARLAGGLIVTRPPPGVFARVGPTLARELLKQAQD